MGSSLRRGRDFLSSDKIFVGFPRANAVHKAVFDQQFWGSKASVVIAGHDETISSGDFENQQISDFCDRKRAFGHEPSLFLGEDITAFAQWPADNDIHQFAARGLVASMANRDWVIGTVEDRSSKIVETCIEQVEGVLSHLFDRSNFSDQKAAFGHEVSAWFDFQTQGVSEFAGKSISGLIPELVIAIDIDIALALPVGDRESTTGADGRECSSDLPCNLLERLADLGQVLQVGSGPDVHMQACNSDIVHIGKPQALIDLLVPDPMFGLWPAGVCLLAMSMSKPRVDSECDARTGCDLTELFDHIGRAAIDMEP